MPLTDSLPVLLVSASTESIANSVILELINNDVTEEYKENESTDRVWRLVNKYYSADVRVHALADGGSHALSPSSVEAHIIHITKDEVGGGEEGADAAARRARAGGVWARAGVRVLLAESAALAPLGAWATAQHADFVPLLEEPAPPERDAKPFAEPCGLERARASLHAHVWSNLRRQPATLPPLKGGGECESDASSEGREDEVRAVERAEDFAAALGALSGAAPAPHASRAERLQRAEELVAAFCRALGLEPGSV